MALKATEVQSDGVHLTFSAFIYWVWRAQNERTFLSKTMTVAAMVLQVRNDVRMKMASHSYRMTQGPEMEERWGLKIEQKLRATRWVQWNRPPAGMHKLNTDGALKNGIRRWGAAVRIHEGVLVRAAQR